MELIRANSFLGAGLTLLAMGCAPEPAPAIPWRESFPLALEAAHDTGKPMLVYFNADWCGICRRVERETFSDPRVKVALQPFIPVKVDIDRQPWLAQKFQIDAVPAYLKIDGGGSAMGHALGYKSPGEMELLLSNWSPGSASP